jgi:hypothetical protein
VGRRTHSFERVLRPSAKAFLRTFSISLAATAAAPALAQYPPPGSVPPPRSITITRDVPQRSAFDPGQPGTVHTVGVAPIEIIFGATDHAITILSDDESAGVASGAATQSNAVVSAMAGANAALDTQTGRSSGDVSGTIAGGGLGGTITGAIGSATGVIGSALSPLSGMGKSD